MKETGILFTPENHRLILSGQKTQTRRVVKIQPCVIQGELMHHIGGPKWESGLPYMSPFGGYKDRLYIKEGVITHCSIPQLIGYYLDGCRATESWMARRTAMFMPKSMARTWLEITEVRVERLQDISASDALAEGVAHTEFWTPNELEGKPFEEKFWDDFEFFHRYPQMVYKKIWDSINGKKHPFESNPWVWVISFKKIK
jgi:hypothetical protein